MSSRFALRAGLVCCLMLGVLGCRRKADLDLAGVVERDLIELATTAPGEIVDLPTPRGAHVARGAVLVRLDPTVATANLAAARADVEAARAAIAPAAQEFARIDRLMRSHVVSQAEWDRSKLRRDDSTAALSGRQAVLAAAEKQLTDLTVCAPADGFVDELPFDQGERVPAGAVVAVLVRDGTPWVRVWLPSRAAANARLDAPAEIRIEGLSAPLHGRLIELGRQPAFTPHYALTERESAHLVYPARVAIEDAPAELRPGLAARVHLALGPQAGAEPAHP